MILQRLLKYREYFYANKMGVAILSMVATSWRLETNYDNGCGTCNMHAMHHEFGRTTMSISNNVDDDILRHDHVDDAHHDGHGRHGRAHLCHDCARRDHARHGVVPRPDHARHDRVRRDVPPHDRVRREHVGGDALHHAVDDDAALGETFFGENKAFESLKVYC